MVSEELAGFTRAQRIWARLGVAVFFLIVGGSAATQSFKHIYDVALIAHQTTLVAFLMPLSIDGMMGIATIAMIEDKAHSRHPRGWARTGLWFGLLVSLAANVASVVAVWGWEWLAIVFAGLPPVLLLWSVEIVSKPGRLRQVAKVIATVSDHIGQLRPHPGSASAGNTNGHQPSTSAATTDGQTVNTPAPPRRSNRPEDSEPLDERLVELALKAGRAWRERTGREITRDGLRAQLRTAGWERGISNVTAGRLLDAIRADTTDEGEVIAAGEPVGAAT